MSSEKEVGAGLVSKGVAIVEKSEVQHGLPEHRGRAIKAVVCWF